MNAFLGAIIEAWGEIKINKARFILSLIGVGVAVWAMATVLALGSITLASEEFFQAVSGNGPGVLAFSVNANTSNSEGFDPAFGPDGPTPADPKDSLSKDIQLVEDADGNLTTKFGAAARATAADLGVTHWARAITVSPEAQASNWTSACSSDECWDNQLNLNGIDPVYLRFSAKTILVGRSLQDADAKLQMNPVVINEKLWKNMGSPAMQTYPRIIVSGDPGLTLTVVGVLKEQTNWESNEIYMHYDGLIQSQPRLKNVRSEEFENGMLKLLVPRGEESQANDVALATLQSRIGPDYEIYTYWSDQDSDLGDNQRQLVTAVVSVIGGIVIMLGAFGLLTVSIVTVRQRIREIGIRRAMGASAKRVFFSVFLESVVATTAAGFTGVMLSILTIRFAPSSLLDFPIPLDEVPYPLSAALLGVLIAAGVGALAGIIPAAIAVKVKPIDAIRY